MEKKYDVFGIGNALLDCVYMVEDKFLEENKIEKGLMTLVDEGKQKSIIEKIKSYDSFIQSGGSVTNSVYTLSQLGGSGYVSVLVSDDDFGRTYLRDLKNSNVITAGSSFTTGKGMTGTCLVLTTPDAERTMNTCLSISSNFSIKNINLNDLKYAKYLYIEGYLVTSEIAMDAIKECIQFANMNDVKIALTFSDLSMVKYFKNNFESILKAKVDLLFCNEEEAKTFSGSNSVHGSIEFLKSFTSNLVITQGNKGSLIVNEEEIITIDPYHVKAIDTVGAGDAFAGSYLYGITNGFTPKKSGDLASLLSSKVVSKIGPRLEKEEINSIKNFFK
jgi:sugar/nucleoside kinase (ribokinase family)